MDYFNRLGELAQRLYRERDYRETSFPAIAAKAFAELPPVEHVAPADVLSWICTTRQLPDQRSIDHAFDDPITLYSGRGFTVELLFWFENTSTIHQHPWCGAYHVLAGSSVHSEFAFEPDDRINSRAVLGTVTWKTSEVLGTGQTKVVLLGREFIHTAFHLESPTVSVILKSAVVPGVEPGYDYLPPFLGLDPYFKPPLLRRQLQALDMLRRVAPVTYLPRLRELVAETDFHGVCLLLIEHLRHLDDDQLHDIVAAARPRHGARLDRLPAVFRELARHSEFAATRLHVRDTEQRFLLGLLMHAPTRSTVLEQVRRRSAGEDPADFVMRQLRAIARLPAGSGEPNPLGLPLGELELELLDGIVRGLDPAQQQVRLSSTYGSDAIARQGDAIRRVIDMLSAWPMLQVLSRT